MSPQSTSPSETSPTEASPSEVPPTGEASTEPKAVSPSSIPTTMRAVTMRSYGGPEVLAIEELPVPTPGDEQVLVKVEVSSLNALDWHFVTGTPLVLRLAEGLRKPKRLVPGADVAGTVVAVGSGASRFSVGDRVFGETPGGGCGPYLVVAEDNLVTIPEGVSFEAAGATPVAALTALQGLRTHADLQPGERVLINGAAGGVGTFSVQIAKAMGAHVTAVCSTRNIEMVRRLGADVVVDYTKDDVVAAHSDADEVRFDVMLDNVGSRSPDECLSMLRPTGRYVAVSGPKNSRLLGPIAHVIKAAFRFWRAEQSFHQFVASPNVEDQTFLAELLADGRVVPEIQRTVGLDGVADGVAEIGTGHTRAKILVDPNR